MAAVRSALAAIDNAEAVDSTTKPVHGGPIAGAVSGLGAADVPRRELSEEAMRSIVHAEATEREAAALEYDGLGRPSDADRLRREAQVLRQLLAGPDRAG